jgi:hypothetical protein
VSNLDHARPIWGFLRPLVWSKSHYGDGSGRLDGDGDGDGNGHHDGYGYGNGNGYGRRDGDDYGYN